MWLATIRAVRWNDIKCHTEALEFDELELLLADEFPLEDESEEEFLLHVKRTGEAVAELEDGVVAVAKDKSRAEKLAEDLWLVQERRFITWETG